MSGDDNFISRWSRRKIAARKGEAVEDVKVDPVIPATPVIPAKAGTQQEVEAHPPLPPVDSLTIDSDFSAFMKPDVDPGLRREALKVLLRDPRFNVMDGLDVYIDDYSKPDPLPESWLAQMNQVKRLGSFVEEAAEPAQPLRKAMPEQPLEADSSGKPSDTENGAAHQPPVTDAGTAGGTLPRKEA